MYFARVSSLVLFAFAMSACSSSSSSSNAPVITGFDAPDTATVTTVQTSSGSEQAYVISGNLNFTDASEVVVSFNVHADPPNANVTIQDAPVNIPSAQQSKNGPLPIQLGLPADPDGKTGYGPGKVNYTIVITSASGLKSAPLAKTITLQ